MTSPLPVRCSTNWAMKPLTLGAGQLWVHMFSLKKWVLMIYEINHIWSAEMKLKWRNDRRNERNLSNCVKKPENGVSRCLKSSRSVTKWLSWDRGYMNTVWYWARLRRAVAHYCLSVVAIFDCLSRKRLGNIKCDQQSDRKAITWIAPMSRKKNCTAG